MVEPELVPTVTEFPRRRAPYDEVTSMTKMATCAQGIPHATKADDPADLEWMYWDGSIFRCRSETCVLCDVNVIYELGTVGGRLRIRRTRKTARGMEVRITPVSPHGDVMDWWKTLTSAG